MQTGINFQNVPRVAYGNANTNKAHTIHAIGANRLIAKDANELDGRFNIR